MSVDTTSSSEQLAKRYAKLEIAAFTQPAIDNHAHPLLRVSESKHASLPFGGYISVVLVASGGAALVNDAPITSACLRRATRQLVEFLRLEIRPAADSDSEVSRDTVKARRAATVRRAVRADVRCNHPFLFKKQRIS